MSDTNGTSNIPDVKTSLEVAVNQLRDQLARSKAEQEILVQRLSKAEAALTAFTSNEVVATRDRKSTWTPEMRAAASARGKQRWANLKAPVPAAPAPAPAVETPLPPAPEAPAPAAV